MSRVTITDKSSPSGASRGDQLAYSPKTASTTNSSLRVSQGPIRCDVCPSLFQLRSFYEHMRFDLQSFCKLADGSHLWLYAISFYAVYRCRSDPGLLGQFDLAERRPEPKPFEVLPYVPCPRHDKSPFTVRIVVCTYYTYKRNDSIVEIHTL
jgi:hypothetical protein